MPTIETTWFETVIAGRSERGTVVIALFDRSIERGEPTSCVAILECSAVSARTLALAAGSVANDAT